MRWSERLKLGIRALPKGQWRCIWCDKTPPAATFESREHVMPESLGGDRNFRLPRGVVCDGCNKGVLKKIDDDLNLHPLICFLRFGCGLGPPIRQMQPGISRDEPEGITIDPSKLAKNASTAMRFDSKDGWALNVQSSGPSPKTRNEHLPRGLHRMAFNAIADAFGGARAVSEFAHLRAYVLSGETVPMRQFLFDEKTLNDSLRSPRPWKASYAHLNDTTGTPHVSLLRLGMAFFYVSLLPTTEPLDQIKSRYPWLRAMVEDQTSSSESP
jgi:hypothetical protein